MSEELKRSLIKMVQDKGKNMGIDLDGDIIFYNGRKYYIDCVNNDVYEV